MTDEQSSLGSHHAAPGHKHDKLNQLATPSPHRPFGADLEPVLKKTCDDRLSGVNWFRTDWQRGGALTGYATFTDDRGHEQPVVVKMPVPPRERRWLQRLQSHMHIAPKLYAHGETLNGYDFAWVVMERLPHGPLGPTWQSVEFDLLAEAASHFYAASAEFPVDVDVPIKDWHAILRQSRDVVQHNDLPHPQKWKHALKKANRKIDHWLDVWNARDVRDWCHGDLHLANAMTRSQAPDGPAVLIDLAEVHPGHWIEDAVYLEHLYWGHRDRMEGKKICSLIAKQRRQLGLPTDDDWPRLAAIRRALFAISTPAAIARHSDPQYLQAALDLLETEVAGK